MPSLEIKTNVKVDNPKALVEEFSQLAAKTLGKPLAYICVSYQYNEYLAWNGTFDPAFLVAVISLDNITPELNEHYSKVFFEYFEEKLGVKDHRGYISFTDPGREYLGHRSTTFGSIFGRNYNYNEFMAWEGSFEPAFLLNVTSLDNMDDPDQNEEFSKALFMYVETKLGAKDHRGYIVFNDPGRVHIGYQSTTMHVIFGPKEETTEQQ
ncbi:hypothetical protein NM688_g1167 [Phlebia brevispora]|uniref:Uncharacterized protein n=1 Tax=Phlebia brevispora TaxID=194682 RepID=A0ACC1TBZ1_9APHY|nr:hypothetical protein NM688_g1167 [Phlebia brevispora]